MRYILPDGTGYRQRIVIKQIVGKDKECLLLMNIIILTEADEIVATGHLMESIELAEALADRGWHAELLVNEDCPRELCERIMCSYSLYRQDADNSYDRIREYVSEKKPDVLVTDLRKADDDLLQKIREIYHGKIICIDELGHRKLSCDVIINPMVGASYWEYQTIAQTFFGAQYLILPRKITFYHKAEKSISDKITRIAVSMGGADSKGTTLKLLRWLPRILPDAAEDIILGGGFVYQREAEELAETLQKKFKVKIYRNVDSIYDFFQRADLAFCAGGNTLHELACIGTPTVVIPTMPHELDNGQVFERAGFGRCLKLSEDTGEDELAKAVREMQETSVRAAMSVSGRRICDGNGCERVVRLIENQIGRR